MTSIATPPATSTPSAHAPAAPLSVSLNPIQNPQSKVKNPLRSLLSHRWLQLALILGILAILLYDRYQLCTHYFFKYTDEDQVIMWYAGDDLLRGRIAEPSYYGQDYNTCTEGFLAAPLGYLGVPWHIACPLVTIFLGLFPFLLFAFIAWRRRHALTAAASLLIPLLLPIRYAMMCGIPRGFHTGIAFAAIPAALLLPPPERRTKRKGQSNEPDQPALANSVRQTFLRRSWPARRYFLTAALAVVSMQLGENCAILLAPAAVYALLTSWKEWKFWVFGAAGLLAALPYPLYVNQFYTKLHPDYVIYLRGDVFTWGWGAFQHYFNNMFAPKNSGGVAVPDLIPFNLPENQAPWYLMIAFIAVGAWLLVRRRTAALAAGFAATLITFVSFGYTRVYATTTSANTASFPYARMWLAIPVVFIYLLFLANHKSWPRLTNAPVARWLTRGGLAGLLIAAIHAAALRAQDLPREVTLEVNSTGPVVCPAIPVAHFYAVAHEIGRIAKENNLRDTTVLVGGGDRWKHLAYALRPVTGIDAMYGPWERRAWRMIEESTAHHDAILFLNHSMSAGATPVGGGKAVTVDENGDPVANLPTLPRSARFRTAPVPLPTTSPATSPAATPAATPATAPTPAGPPPVSLPANIDLARVSFTSLNGTKTYLPGKDFSVEKAEAGDVQLLRRTPTSAIAEGETILLSWKGITTYSIPTIYMLKTDGKNAYDVGVPGLASVYTPASTIANPNPSAQVIGNGR